MHLVGVHPMHGGLGDRQAFEDPERAIPRSGKKRGAIEELANFAPIALGLGLPHDDLEVRRAD